MIPRTSIIPPTGFHFIEKVDDETQRIEGGSYHEVAENLLKYRIANNLPLGNPLEEVYAFVCAQWPHFCTDQKPPTSEKTTTGNFTQQVLAWAQALKNRRTAASGQTVESVAQRRADICRACPMMKDWRDYPCGPCLEAIDRAGFVFRAGKDLSEGRKLGGCSVLHQDNRTAIWAAKAESLPEITEEQRAKLPQQCWRK